MDFSLFYSWTTNRYWGLLGFNLKEQEEKNNVQSKIKCMFKRKKQTGKSQSKLSSNLILQTMTLDKCAALTKEQMVSSTVPNAELDAIPVLGVGSEFELDQHNHKQRPRMGALFRGSLGRNQELWVLHLAESDSRPADSVREPERKVREQSWADGSL